MKIQIDGFISKKSNVKNFIKNRRCVARIRHSEKGETFSVNILVEGYKTGGRKLVNK